MLRVRIAILVIALTGVVLALSVWQFSQRAAADLQARESATNSNLTRKESAARAPSAPAPSATATATPPASQNTASDYQARFRNAGDMLTFVASIQDAAQAGDGVAQFYMYRAIHRCWNEYMIYFGRGERERTLDQALINAEQMPGYSADAARELFQQCRRFKEANPTALLEGWNWLQAAVKSRYPLALSAMAAERGSSEFGSMNPNKSPEQYAEVRALAREALLSKDPQVIFDLARVTWRLTPQGESSDETAAVWVIAACTRGFDCSSNSESFSFVCRLDAACQPYETGIDILRRQFGSKFDDLQERAHLLNEQIDQGRFDEFWP